MSEVFFTSDTHFNHKFVAALRGYGTISYDDNGHRIVEADIERYNYAMVEGWNDVVSKDDTVWHLGDFALGTWEQTEIVLRQLNGYKHLITGNHDRCWPGNRNSHIWQRKYIDAGFESVQPYARRKINGKAVFLSHFPYEGDHKSEARPEGEDRYTQYRLRDEGEWLLHGHTHANTAFTGGKQIHVGIDAWSALAPLESVSEIIRRTELESPLDKHGPPC